jgi:hypothetical protein
MGLPEKFVQLVVTALKVNLNQLHARLERSTTLLDPSVKTIAKPARQVTIVHPQVHRVRPGRATLDTTATLDLKTNKSMQHQKDRTLP